MLKNIVNIGIFAQKQATVNQNLNFKTENKILNHKKLKLNWSKSILHLDQFKATRRRSKFNCLAINVIEIFSVNNSKIFKVINLLI